LRRVGGRPLTQKDRSRGGGKPKEGVEGESVRILKSEGRRGGKKDETQKKNI